MPKKWEKISTIEGKYPKKIKRGRNGITIKETNKSEKMGCIWEKENECEQRNKCKRRELKQERGMKAGKMK